MASNRAPLYSGRYQVRELQAVQGTNLLRWSEQVIDPVWSKNNNIIVAQDALGSPTTTTVADKIYGANNSIGASISQTVDKLPFNTKYNFSAFLKPAGFNYAAVTVEALSSSPTGTASVGRFTTIVDLSTGLVTDTITTLSAFYNKEYTIESYGTLARSIISNDKLQNWSQESFVADISSGGISSIVQGYSSGVRATNNNATGKYSVTKRILSPEEQQQIDSTFYLRLSVSGDFGTVPVNQLLTGTTADSYLLIGPTPAGSYQELAGKVVTTSFWARASQPTKIFSESQVHASGQDVTSPMWTPVQWQVFDLTTQWQKFTHTRVFPTTAQVAQVAYNPDQVYQSIVTDSNNPIYTPLTATNSLPPLSTWNDQIDIKTMWNLASHRAHGNHANRPPFPGTAMPEATLQQIVNSAIENGWMDIALPRFEVGDASSLNEDWLRFSVTGNPYIGEVENTLTSSVTCSIKATITPLSARTDAPQSERNGNNSNGLYIWGSQLQIADYPREYIPTTSTQNSKVLKYGGQAGNLIYYSQDFTQGNSKGWIKTNITVTSNAEISPRGFREASKIVETTANGKHQLRHEESTPNAGQYTASIYAKKGERRYLQMSLEGTTTPAIFDLETGTVTQNGSFDPYIEKINGGWYRCSITYLNQPNGYIMSFGVSNLPTGSASYGGNSTNGIFVWGAQVERTAWAGEHVITDGAPFTRYSHYDFSTEETVEPSLTMPYNFNHLYWSDVYDDTRTLWTFSNGARAVSLTSTFVPLNIRNTDSLNYCSQLIEGTTASPEGFRMSQTHDIRYEWDESYDGRYTFSIYAKQGSRRYVRLDLDALTVTDVFLGRTSLVADLQTGSITQPAEAVGLSFLPTGTIEDVGDGWRRLTVTGFFGLPDNRVVTFNEEFLRTFTEDDLLQFQQTLRDFDIKGIKQIRPRIIISNGPNFNDVNYTGNGTGNILIWGAQLEAGPTATKYTSNTTGKTRSYDGSVTRLKLDTVYYFPIIRLARDEKTFAFQVDATYDRTRRTTGNDTLILYNNKIGYKNTAPTFHLDISGSVAATRASVPSVSTARFHGGNVLTINSPAMSINTNVSANGSLDVKNLTALDVVVSTNVSFFSSLKIPVPVTPEQFEALPIDVDILTENFFVTDFLSSGNISARESLNASLVNSNLITVSGNFIPLQGNVGSNISPKNILYFTERLDTLSYWATADCRIISNAATAPDGTMTADKLAETGTLGWPRHLRNEQFVTSERTYVYSVYAKAAEKRYLGIDIRETIITLSPEQIDTPRINLVVDLQDGSIASPLSSTTSSQAISAAVIPVGNSWYRIGIVFRPNITPKEPNDPSSIRIRHSILNDVTPTTLTRFRTVIEPPLPGARDIDTEGMKYTGTNNSGLLLWGTQLEYGTRLTNYEKNEQRILPDIYTNNIIGKVPLDPSLTNPVIYTPQDELRVDRNVNLVYGIKPSDSYSSDSPTLIRALTGDWDKDHNAHELGVFKPFFKNWWGVVDYVRTQGLFGNSLTILLYEDVIGNNNPPNLSPWPTNHPYYNLSATTPTDVSGLRAQGTAGYTRLARRWGGGDFETDVYTTEWLGANYPALTAAGLRGGTYTWRAGNYVNRNLTNIWIPGRALEIRRDINFSNITFQGLFNILPRVTMAAVSSTLPSQWAAEHQGTGYTPTYKTYYIKEKPYDMAPPKVLLRSYICSNRLANFEDGRTNTTNGGGGWFGNGTGDPTLFTRTSLFLSNNGEWSFDRAHLTVFDMRPSVTMNFKNVTLEQEHNCTDATPALWVYGTVKVANTTVVSRGNAQYMHWGSGAYEEGHISTPNGIWRYNGEYQIDPYYLTPSTWNSNLWTTVIGAKGKAYYPGYGLAIVGSLPKQAPVGGVTRQPWDPTPMYSWFVSPFEHTASTYFTDADTPGRQFGRNSYLQGSLIMDGHWCAQPGNVIANIFTKRRQSAVVTDGLIFKGDNFFWHDYDIIHSYTTVNSETRLLTAIHGSDPTFDPMRRRVNFYPLRGGGGMINLFNTSVGLAPWTFGGTLPAANTYTGTALYYRARRSDNNELFTYGTWDDRWFVLDTNLSAVDHTGFMTPQSWYQGQRSYEWEITAPSNTATVTIPDDGPTLLNYGTGSNTGFSRYYLTIDGYRVSPTSFRVTANTRVLEANQWFSIRYPSDNLSPILTALQAYEFFVSQTGTTVLQIPPGPNLPTTIDTSTVRVTRVVPGTNYTKTLTYLTPGTDYNINPVTRQITFTTAIPVTQRSARADQFSPTSTRKAFNIATQIIVEQLQFAANSQLKLQFYPSDSTAFVDNIINSIVERKPHWVKTNDNRFVLSAYRSPNQLDSYRNWFTINSPINNVPYTLAYYTTATNR